MANASARHKKNVKRKVTKKTVKVRETASTFAILKNSVKTIQVLIGSYAFLDIMFWLAYTGKFVGQEGIYFLFKPAWDFVNIFYTYKSVQGKDEVDFTGVVCAICLMVVAIILKSVYEYLAELEENAKIADIKRKERAEKRAVAQKKTAIHNRNLAKNQESGFVFLLDISIKQVSGFIQEDVLSPEEIAKIKNNFFTTLMNNLNLNQVLQKGYYKKKLFLVYKNAQYFDDFIYYTRETLNSMSKEFVRPTLRIDFLVGLNAIAPNEDFKEKLDILDTVNKLNLKNEFICTQSLKDIYSCMPKQNYVMSSKGVYNLSKNLNVSNNQEIFSLREDTY